MFRSIACHIGIYAYDVEALKDWYCRILDFQMVHCLLKADRPPIYFLRKDDLLLELLPTREARQNRMLTAPGISHVAFRVEDFNSVLASLEANGITVENVRSTSNGWNIGYFRDIENNWIEIYECEEDPFF